MQPGRVWRAYPALSKPLTIMGVERKWFLLSATLGMAMWNAINSILIGIVIFGALYADRVLGVEAGPQHARDPAGVHRVPRPLRSRQVGRRTLVSPGPPMIGKPIAVWIAGLGAAVTVDALQSRTRFTEVAARIESHCS